MARTHRWGLVRGLGLGLAAVALLLAVTPAASAAPASNAGSAETPEVGTADWKQVSTGYYHTCGVRVTGRLYCWGQDSRSQLGDGGANTNSSVPVEVAGNATDWKSVSAGSGWTCAIKTTGQLFCWGRDDFGQGGNGPGTTGDQSVPVQVGSATDWKSVSSGLGETTCGRRATKRIYCWGRDNNGQVGNGLPFADVTSPTAVGTHADWTSVSTGGYHSCGRRSNGRIYCWGDDQEGAVGDGGGGVDRPAPVQVAGNHNDWTAVSAGINHTCGRRTSGRLYCVGADINGAVGNGGGINTNFYSPVQVAGGATDWRSVASGSYGSCATKTSGRLYCWGDNAFGQVGNGNPNGVPKPSPVQVIGNATDWAASSSGNGHVCARKTNARIYCWGYGFFGQRGDGQSGSNAPQPTPTEVS